MRCIFLVILERRGKRRESFTKKMKFSAQPVFYHTGNGALPQGEKEDQSKKRKIQKGGGTRKGTAPRPRSFERLTCSLVDSHGASDGRADLGLLPMPIRPIISTCAARRKSRQTGRRRAYGPWSRSGRRRRGRQPCCPGAAYGRCPAGSHGEILLAVLQRPLLVGAGDKVLEAGRVGGVAVMDTSTPSCFMMATPRARRSRRSTSRRHARPRRRPWTRRS